MHDADDSKKNYAKKVNGSEKRPNTLSTWRFWKRRGHKPSNRKNKQHRHVSNMVFFSDIDR